MAERQITQEYVRSLFEYDPETGVLTWKGRPREHFSTDRAWKSTNARMAGKITACSVNSDGYSQVGIDRCVHKAHRIIWLLVHGEMPEEVDHENGVRTDNRLANLRAATRLENMKNKAVRRDSRSGVAGVSWHEKDRRWIAYIRSGGRQIRLGAFTDFADACSARKTAERTHGFHANHGRPRQE